jgi:hypothetical protein
MENKKEQETNDSTNNHFIESPKFKLAVIILIFYLAFMAYLIFNIDIDETHWGRFLFLFTGIEAIVFAAVGYVFGRDVSRRAEASAEKNTKDAKKEKEEANKKTHSVKEDLIRLQEAVLSENNSLSNFGKSNLANPVRTHEAKSSTLPNQNLFNSRALSLVLQQQESNKSNPFVSFNFKVEVDDFQSITIDGDTKYSSEGYFSSVYTYGNSIEVAVDRDNFKTWTFVASDITDEDGREMIMSNTPLETNGNKSSFHIEYK